MPSYFGWHYLPVLATTGSCARPRPSHLPRLALRQGVCAGCRKALPDIGLLPGVASAHLSPDAWLYTLAVPLVHTPHVQGSLARE
jgi:hypothetical protein